MTTRLDATLSRRGSLVVDRWARQADAEDRLMTGCMLQSLDDFARTRTRSLGASKADASPPVEALPAIDSPGEQLDGPGTPGRSKVSSRASSFSYREATPLQTQRLNMSATAGSRMYSLSPTFYKYERDLALKRAAMIRGVKSAQAPTRSQSTSGFKTRMRPIKYYPMGHFLGTTQSTVTMNPIEDCTTGVLWKNDYSQTNYGRTFRAGQRELAHYDACEGHITQTTLKNRRLMPLSKEFKESKLFSMNDVERDNAQADFTDEFNKTYGRTTTFKPEATRYKLTVPRYDKSTTYRNSYAVPSESMNEKLREVAQNTNEIALALKGNGATSNPMGLDKAHNYNTTSIYTDNNKEVTQYNARMRHEIQEKETKQMKEYILKNAEPYIDAQVATEWMDTVPHDVKTRFTGFVRQMRLMENDE